MMIRSMTTTYFDWAATAPILPEALQTYMRTAEGFIGNPSSVHSFGKAASSELSMHRAAMAGLLGTEPGRLTFTSGGTESNAMICRSFLCKRRPQHIIISGIEHPSLYEFSAAFQRFGHRVSIVRAPQGITDLRQLERSLSDDTTLVMVMAVNNVLGTVQPLKEIREILDKRSRRIHLHVDAVQALGKIANERFLPYADSASFSAHKIQGPRGIGMLYSRRPVEVLSPGGGQESGIRPGTEDLPSIAAFHTAAEHSMSGFTENSVQAMKIKRAAMERIQSSAHLQMLDDSEDSSPYILAVSAPGIPSEVFTRVIGDKGFAISTGSACSSRSRQKMQRVLLQSGYRQTLCDSALRISFGPETDADDLDSLVSCMIEAAAGILQDIG